MALVTDLKKAYQAIHTGPMELHLRRFLFRKTDQQEWEDYAFTRATFGGRGRRPYLGSRPRDGWPSWARRSTSRPPNRFKTTPMWTTRYSAGPLKMYSGCVGERVGEAYTGTVPQILARGAMTVKFMAVSGSSDPWEAEQLAGKTLGVQYRLQEDEIVLVLRPGFYESKSKELRPGQSHYPPRQRPSTRDLDGKPTPDKTTSSQYGNGNVRPAGPGKPGVAAREAAPSETLWAGCR